MDNPLEYRDRLVSMLPNNFVKHLPGKHDQKEHGEESIGGVGGVPKSEIKVDSRGRKHIEHQFKEQVKMVNGWKAITEDTKKKYIEGLRRDKVHSLRGEPRSPETLRFLDDVEQLVREERQAVARRNTGLPESKPRKSKKRTMTTITKF